MRIQIEYYRRKANIDTDRGDIQSACMFNQRLEKAI